MFANQTLIASTSLSLSLWSGFGFLRETVSPKLPKSTTRGLIGLTAGFAWETSPPPSIVMIKPLLFGEGLGVGEREGVRISGLTEIYFSVSEIFIVQSPPSQKPRMSFTVVVVAC